MFRVVLLTVIGLIGIGCQTINSDADDGNDQDDTGIITSIFFFLKNQSEITISKKTVNNC